MQIELKPEKKQKSNLLGVSLVGLLSYFSIFMVFFVGYFVVNNGFMLLKTPNFVKEYKTYDINLGTVLPQDIKNSLVEDLKVIEFNGVKRFNVKNEGESNLKWIEGEGFNTQYYVPISNYYAISNTFNSEKQNIYIEKETSEDIKAILKNLYPNVKETDNLSAVLDKNGKNVALINFKDLTYTYQLLLFNDKYFLDDIDGGIKFSLVVDTPDTLPTNILKDRLNKLNFEAFEKEKIGKINQTGVTAITRMLAKKTDDSKDMGYPARKISSFLKDADITHVSNEISFVPGCVPVGGMRFCSKPEYLKTLKDSGVDVVELTGNHNNDYGADWNLYTIKTYDKNSIQYFGGGKNSQDAEKILYLDIKGTNVAFIGYNYYDTILGTGAIAGKDRAGSNSYSVSKLKKNIETAKSKADLVIVDFQFQECYSYPPSDVIYPICYKPLSNPNQISVFRQAINYGADIVVGTQAHQPQTYEIYKGKLIFYGLGNLFFDQINWVGTRHGLILSHYLYKGKLIQTKLTTTNYNSDLQTYVSKGSERTKLLELLKEGRNF